MARDERAELLGQEAAGRVPPRGRPLPRLQGGRGKAAILPLLSEIVAALLNLLSTAFELDHEYPSPASLPFAGGRVRQHQPPDPATQRPPPHPRARRLIFSSISSNG